MSFPFYSRLSSKVSRSRDPFGKDLGSKHASATFATGAFNLSDTTRIVNADSHTHSSSRMRFIPFLGKRRKSLATLRPCTVPEEDNSVDHGLSGGGHRRNKTVSQLGNEPVARLTRSSLVPAGSRSTGNLELSACDTSLKLGLDPDYATPTKNRLPEARHAMFPARSTQNSTPDKTPLGQSKRASEKPAKTSFLSRISSRPSLASRYSSADLKSTSRARGLFKSSEKIQGNSVTPQRKEIIHPVHASNRQSLADDKDFFTSPRTAPTPPNLSFTSPDSSLLESPLGASRSTVTLPSQNQSPLFVEATSRSPRRSSIRHVNATQATKHNSSPTVPGSLSPETALKTPRRHSVSTHNTNGSPSVIKSAISSDITTSSPSARPRGSHVRIGKEKVTISVANMLEAELGVEVGDSEDSSFYDDSFEDPRRIAGISSHKIFNQETSFNSSSDLPPLSSSDDFDFSFKFPKIKESNEVSFALEAQSPLSALMSATIGEKDYSPSPAPVAQQHTSIRKERQTSGAAVANSQLSVNHAQERGFRNSRSIYLHSLGSQSREVDHLDRISERSVPILQNSPRGVEDRNKNATATSNHANVSAVELQHALDVQCARFDKLAGHLLQIIQRHQSEKVQLESQITNLQKEAQRNEREIKALRKLIAHTNERIEQEGWSTRRLVRIASMQSFLSNISGRDEEVDMSVAVEMLARAGRRKPLLSPDIPRDVRASMDLSPTPASTSLMKKVDLRRSKTMPDLHKASMAVPSPIPSTPREATPDLSGLGLGLDFPLPEPLKLPSIASTIMSSAKDSSASVPALTATTTAASGLSLSTEPSVVGCEALSSPSESKSGGINHRAERSARKKRMAGEWRARGDQGLYRPADDSGEDLFTESTYGASGLSASTSYATNLSTSMVTTPIEQLMNKDSPDLDAIYKKLVLNSNGLLG